MQKYTVFVEDDENGHSFNKRNVGRIYQFHSFSLVTVLASDRLSKLYVFVTYGENGHLFHKFNTT